MFGQANNGSSGGPVSANDDPLNRTGQLTNNPDFKRINNATFKTGGAQPLHQIPEVASAAHVESPRNVKYEPKNEYVELEKNYQQHLASVK